MNPTKIREDICWVGGIDPAKIDVLIPYYVEMYRSWSTARRPRPAPLRMA